MVEQVSSLQNRKRSVMTYLLPLLATSEQKISHFAPLYSVIDVHVRYAKHFSQFFNVLNLKYLFCGGALKKLLIAQTQTPLYFLWAFDCFSAFNVFETWKQRTLHFVFIFFLLSNISNNSPSQSFLCVPWTKMCCSPLNGFLYYFIFMYVLKFKCFMRIAKIL